MSKPHAPTIATLRQQIDVVDNELLALLGRRQGLVRQVITVKKEQGLPARIPDRVSEIIARLEQAAPEKGASPELVRAVWTAMVEWFIAHEERELKG